MKRPIAVMLAAGAFGCVGPVGVLGNGTGGQLQSPNPPPVSQGSASIVLNTLEAGAGGTYTPIAPDHIQGDFVTHNPLRVPPPPDPEGKSCPSVTTFRSYRGGTVQVVRIYPTFTKSSDGGYDGSDPDYGYHVHDAVPPGGDPTQTTLGSPATAANIAGHVLTVGAFMQQAGTWHDKTPGVPPYGGSCVGATFTFSPPVLAGFAPPPTPPSTVLNTPPFATGPALMAEVTGAWRIGSVETLPGPAATARTYVNIPTCAWLNTGVPSTTVPMHAVKTTVEDGVTLFLVYNLTIAPGTVAWDWGDGTQTQSSTAPVAPPSSLPSYDASTQTWTDPCSVSHAYPTVATGRTITAAETFTVTITVSWDDGAATHTADVPCDAATGGPCQLVVGPSNGWRSGPHPVDQIEPVPYLPTPQP